jgi:predicted P-loop ATPase/GTPase
MNNNHMQKIIDDSYEILELNASEPIIFEANKKYEQPTYNEKNNQVILIVPREKQITRRTLD